MTVVFIAVGLWAFTMIDNSNLKIEGFHRPFMQEKIQKQRSYNMRAGKEK